MSNKSATGKAKKNDDIIGLGEEESNSISLGDEDEISVQKPGMLEKRVQKNTEEPKSEFRAVTSDNVEYFDIE